MKSLRSISLMFLFAALLVSACEPVTISEPAAPVAATQPEAPQETPTEISPAPTATPTKKPTPTEVVIPADPQMIDFQSADGTALKGVYYPPATGPAPVVVLMHQYPLDHETQWFAIAPWLQDRGLTESVPVGSEPWGDPSWFPAVPEELNVGVFIFTFRGCQGGCQNADLPGGDRSLWAEDARAALLHAASLPGADPERIVAVGTSIGADGAVDGCLLAEEDDLHCVGAVSWSPGGFLDMSYDSSVGQLTELGVPVRCVAGEADGASAATCRSFTGEGYQIDIDPSSNHGIALVNPDIEVKVLDLLLAFLQKTVA
ncbi:MAG: hypothetical protein K8R77_04930 [Anaerolineaceae bacterium]|nr:hypothetical protein [Anaerolineaceae bacterium]